MGKPTFVNEAKPRDQQRFVRNGGYTYDKPSKLLFVWSRLFQSVISQASTFMFTGKFHTQQCSIYKCEGGCSTPLGDLVLVNDTCYFDGFYCENKKWTRDTAEKKALVLISDVVLKWDPMDPVNSMIHTAAKFVGAKPKELRKAIEASTNGGVFGGNALADFFSWNPFGEPPVPRDYERWCMKKFNGKSDKEIDQMYADIDLGKDLLKRMLDAINAVHQNNCYVPRPMCCSPRRDGDKLGFWINTGTSSPIDGWKSQDDIEAFIKNGVARLKAR